MAYRKDESLIGIVHKGHLLPYIMGVVSTLMGIIVLIFIIYMIPYLFFDVAYPIPDFMIDFNFWLQHQGQKGNVLTLLGLVIPPILFSIGLFFLAAMVTHELEKLNAKRLHDHEGEDSQKMLEASYTDTEHLTGKVFLIFLGLIAFVVLIETWVLASL